MQIDVVCCFDNNLAVQAAIMANSVARYASKEYPVKIHAHYVGRIDSIDLTWVCRLLNSAYFEIRFIEMRDPFDERYSIAASNSSYYLRLAAFDAIGNVDRLVYLDVDLLVNESLADLYELDLKGKGLAACVDVGLEGARSKPRTAKNILMSQVVLRDYVERISSPGNSYINTGVMVVDISGWRSDSISRKCLDYVQHSSYLLFADQDAINYVMQGRITLIQSRWNCIPMYQKEDLSNAAIVHYAGHKPWKITDPDRPGDKEYWAFAMSTPFGRLLRRRQLGELQGIYKSGLKRLPSTFRAALQTSSRILKKFRS